MYCLNYFRAIQKRLALDLREFGTRDRVDSHQVNPFIFSEEANKQVEMNATWAPNMYEAGSGGIDARQNEKPCFCQVLQSEWVIQQQSFLHLPLVP
jgi:hypothetical protein